ncbi:MAG: hypothetical protein GX185_01130 [Tissierellia bacterium]|nr:hypothetical protein [Tissierellia bacterium]
MDMRVNKLLDLMESKETSSEEITKACIEKIDGDMSINTLLKDEALEKARDVDNKRKDGEKVGALAGLPAVVVDNISTKDVLTTAGSKMLENYIPPFNATVIERLLEEDCILLGKVKVEEFAYEPSANVERVLDKGGAAFGISSNMVPNKISMKPSYGLVSRYGVIGGTSSFDQLVPVTNSVKDLALVLKVIAGHDEKDSTSVKREKVDYTKALDGDIKGLKISVPTDLSSNDKVKKLVEQLTDLGAVVKEVALETLKYILPAYRILSSAEFASNMGRYDGIKFGYRTKDYSNREELYKRTRAEAFSEEAKKRILFGNYVISSGQYEKYYLQAQRVRAMIRDEVAKVVAEDGFLVLPYGFEEEFKAYSLVSNMTGLPAITLGNGIQLIGPAFKEEDLIRLAYNYEKAYLEVENNG